MIEIVGMGTRPDQITAQGAAAIARHARVYVKTALTQTFAYFTERGIETVSLDRLYEQAEDFDALDEAIAEYLIAEHARYGDLCYCVNGSGADDRSVHTLAARAQVRIVPGVALADAAGVPSAGSVRIGAGELAAADAFDYDTRLSLCVTELDDRLLAGEVKLKLAGLIGEETAVRINGQAIALYELDRLPDDAYRWDTVLSVPPIETTDKHRFNVLDLYRIMRRLRADDGCPWDRAQTHKSIRANAIEEAYELVDAIDRDDVDNMIEESGDVLLQAMFHCVIGEDCGEYDWQDAVSALCRKLIDRHTHIFGNVVATTPEEALRAWDAAKAKEKYASDMRSKIERIAGSLPASMYAYKVQRAARKAGFEFANEQEIADKIAEETREFLSAADGDDKESEGGDLLFAAVNLLRWNGIDPEVALRRATEKFARRACYIDAKYGSVAQQSRETFDRWWEEAKRETRDAQSGDAR